MIFKAKHHFFLIGLLLAVFGSVYAQNQDSGRLMEYLKSRSFPDLIETEKQEQISLATKGRIADRVAARTYTIQEGWRCQVFAGVQRSSADEMAANARALGLDSVYVFLDEDNLYKVQVGNFKDRKDAEALLERLRRANFRAAWVTRGKIHAPKSAAEIAAYQAALKEKKAPPENIYFSIQVFASRDRQRAEQIKASFENEIEQPVRVMEDGSYWKVMVGKFPSRSTAESFLSAIRKQRFGDAWIAQIVGS